MVVISITLTIFQTLSQNVILWQSFSRFQISFTLAIMKPPPQGPHNQKNPIVKCTAKAVSIMGGGGVLACLSANA